MARIEVKSEITGTLWKLTSQVGDTVEEGAVLMIVESMKMEIPVASPADGTLKSLHVALDDVVAEGQLVAVIES